MSDAGKPWNDRHYLASDGESSVAAEVAVGGRRRGSWRRLEMPASLLKEALDLEIF